MDARRARLDSDGLKEMRRSGDDYHAALDRVRRMDDDEFRALGPVPVDHLGPTAEGWAMLDDGERRERRDNPEQYEGDR